MSVVAFPIDPSNFEPQADRAEGAERHARKHAGNDGRFAEFVDAVRTMVAMLRDYRAGKFTMSWTEVVIVIGALAYVANPFDAVPEALLGPAGLGDDVAAVLAAVGALGAAIQRYMTSKR
ncbi:YkvA family protein [Demequina pelophila]|uniref:YkvA family protein n=1 Tax=Demequina pelophila TaxID=1638984 RepID=UPI0007808BD9|nr:YkvA family protein [Demequina pelophila]